MKDWHKKLVVGKNAAGKIVKYYDVTIPVIININGVMWIVHQQLKEHGGLSTLNKTTTINWVNKNGFLFRDGWADKLTENEYERIKLIAYRLFPELIV